MLRVPRVRVCASSRVCVMHLHLPVTIGDTDEDPVITVTARATLHLLSGVFVRGAFGLAYTAGYTLMRTDHLNALL